jgi:transcriptional activator of cad operon
MDENNIILIDGWQIDASSCRIARNGQEKKLELRSMELLLYLVDHPDQVVTREEIEENVWQGRVVGYDALSASIAKIRKAFEDSSKQPRVIETIPKVGYRLIASVSEKSILRVSFLNRRH